MASQELINIIIKATDEASAAANKVDQNLRKIGKTSNALSKIPGFDTMKNKLGQVATSIDTRFGGALTRARNHFNTFKNRVVGVGTTIKGKFGGAIDGIRNKLNNFRGSANQAANGLGFLKGAASMAAGMIGYELVSSIVEGTRASLNARSGLQAFAQRLNMSSTEVANYQKSLDELQKSYRKIDMDVVGQQATDMAYRLGLPETALTELTETTAIFSDAMQRNGRSAEDSMLAMSDAMDGQFVRLKEIGIGQEDLMKNGWSGDINDKTGLLHAMNKALKEQHYDELAKSVDTLDDAWQVLSVTLSNLLEQILLPLTPAIVAVVNGLTDAVGWIQNAWNSLPEWGKAGIVIAGVATAVGLIGGAIATVGIAGIPILGTIVAAIGAISWPALAVAAAIGAIVYAVYEVGKAFGWWKDVNSMLAAVQAGVMRLWSAFINHPDVQAAIKAIVDAWNWLVPAIGNAFKAVMNFFGVNSNGKFDIVRMLIDGIGQAWQTLTGHIRLVISIVQALANGFMNFYNGVLVPLGNFLTSVFGPVWDAIVGVLNTSISTVSGLISIFDQFKQGQIDLPTAVMSALKLLFNAYTTIFGMISTTVGNFAMRLLSYGLRAAYNLLTGMVTWLSQLPVRVLTYLSKTRQHIVTQLQQWVSLARQRAMQLLTGIISYISQLPGRVAAFLLQVLNHISSSGYQWIVSAKSRAQAVVNGVIEFLSQLPGKVASAIAGVLTTILDAGSQWVSNAISKAQEVVDGAAGALSSLPGRVAGALGGVVDAIVKPFRDAYNQAKSIWDSIASLANNTPTVRASAGGEGMTEYLDANSGAIASGTISTINSAKNNVNVNGTIKHTVNVTGIPSNAGKSEVERLFTQMLNDKTFKDKLMREIASSSLFQSLDAKEKQRLLGKSNRSLGV